MRSSRRLWLAVVPLLFAPPAAALSYSLSSASSDATPAAWMSATVDVMVLEGDTLQLTLNNDTAAPTEFNINRVFFNGSTEVSGLSLHSAMHSAAGDVLADWSPVESSVTAGGFGIFDFGLRDGVGENDPTVAGPSESIVFVLSITGACADALSCTASDFVNVNAKGLAFAAKFVSGPDDPEAPGVEDSGFGAIPEPRTALLVGGGLAALGLRRWTRC